MTKTIGNYIIVDQISICNDGFVYKAFNQKFPSNTFAVRIIPNQLLTPNKVIALERELSILHSAIHPNILGVKDIISTPQNYSLIFDYCNGGNLSSLLESSKIHQIDIKFCQHITRQIVNAMTELHSKHITYNNLSLGNVLLSYSTENEEIPIVKLSNFRLAQFSEANSKTYAYDILDIGRIAQVMINSLKYCKVEDRELYEAGLDFIKHCLQVSYGKHLEMNTLKLHPFISKANCEDHAAKEKTLEHDLEWLVVDMDIEDDFDIIELDETKDSSIKTELRI